MSMTWVSLLLQSRLLCAPKISGLYVTIVRLLAHLKRFWLNDQMSPHTAGVLPGLYFAVRVLSPDASA